MFEKILIANRGEIALRIIRTCKDMGIATVAVFSDADRDSLPVRWADEAVHIGPPLSRKSYLNGDKIIQAAKESGADAVHPGYGFLSENAAFAAACRDHDLIFIGPAPESIALAGNKAAARKTLSALGIPVIPGSPETVAGPEEALAAARQVGYPVILKAAGGGGGRGLRIARDDSELVQTFKIAAGEARATCGNGDLYLEKYLQHPRHIEIQILGDSQGHYVHLGERECSIQKRYQKLLEESPSPMVDQTLREKMGAAAIRIARAIGYVNAGTMEFLVDRDRNFYFMEVNARIQVEHPVTEWVTGIDIVRQQLLIAAGETLSFGQEAVCLNGWAMECRINAADPENDFMPSPGTIRDLIMPAGPGVRVDSHLYNGCEISPFYDSLIAKVTVWGEDREMAIRRMGRALSEFRAEGINVTTGFHQKVLQDTHFRQGDFDTHFLDAFATRRQAT